MQNALPELDVTLTNRRVRVLWVLSSAAGMALAAAAARPLSYVVGEAVGGVLGEVPAEAAIGAVAGGGVLGGIAFAQWFLLRRRVSWAGRWPAANALAGANAAAAGFVVARALTLAGYEALGAGAAGVAGLGAFLAAFWLVLRRHVPAAPWLAVASAGGFVLAAIVTVMVGAAVGFEGESPLFGALFGAVYGSVTVFTFGRLVPS